MAQTNLDKDFLIDLSGHEDVEKETKQTSMMINSRIDIIEQQDATKNTSNEYDQTEPSANSIKKHDDSEINTNPKPEGDNDKELQKLKEQNVELEKKVQMLQTKLDNQRNDLEREVQRRCDMEQRFTEDAKRSSDQIEELISKSNQDDAKIMEFQKTIEYYADETSKMIESFTTNREVLTSQLQHLRYENDFLLGKFLPKSHDLQNEVINLPQTVEELQFYCLKITEKLILATLARERLEESFAAQTSQTSTATNRN